MAVTDLTASGLNIKEYLWLGITNAFEPKKLKHRDVVTDNVKEDL